MPRIGLSGTIHIITASKIHVVNHHIESLTTLRDPLVGIRDVDFDAESIKLHVKRGKRHNLGIDVHRDKPAIR